LPIPLEYSASARYKPSVPLWQALNKSTFLCFLIARLRSHALCLETCFLLLRLHISVMNGALDFSIPGIGQIQIAGQWLSNSRLPICIAKPPRRVDEILDNAVATDSVAFVQAVFGGAQTDTALLKTWFNNEAGLVLFPEYAFSSQDFATIDRYIRGYPGRVIVLAGFGAVPGPEIAALLTAGCESSWKGGGGVLVAHGVYNAGWCWINDPPAKARCIIFIKNFIDQAIEITEIPNLFTVGSILRIEAEDLVIYPLICSDLISNQADGPRSRIAKSLPNLKRVAVCTISCNVQPESGWWRTAIDDVVQMQQQQTVAIFVNQAVTTAKPEEDQDRWRCLTGAFISRTRMPSPPQTPLPSLRHVETEAAATGLLLRDPVVGLAVGLVGWDCNAGVGSYVFEPRMRLAWEKGCFETTRDTVETYETRRFLARRATEIASQFAPEVQPPVIDVLAALVSEPDATKLNPRLWPDLLDGLRPPTPPRSPDELHCDQWYLDRAFAIFGAVQSATNGQPVMRGPKRGQLSWDNKELRIWASPRFLEGDMFESLRELALEGGSAPPLIVIARGRGLGADVMPQPVPVPEPVVPQRAVPDRRTDITYAAPQPGESFGIESPRLRQIFWQRMADVEEVLVHPPAAWSPAVRLAITQGLGLN
jgi:hypothetical protein